MANPLGHTRTFVTDTMGRAVQATGPLGEVSTLAYDPRGRLTQGQDPLGQIITRGYEARGLLFDPKVSLFRPWRDTRFSENKAPLKTNIAATFPNRTLGRMNGAGLYFEVATTWVWIGGGIYAPDASQLQAIREHVAGHRRRFAKVIRRRRFGRSAGPGRSPDAVPRGWRRTIRPPTT
jgi:YD repeat-containing protein